MKPLSCVPDERMRPIRFLVMDVDGVLTEGGICYSESGEELKTFDVQDGAGIKYWQRAGHACAVLTGRSSPVVERRAAELGITLVEMGAKDKLPVLKELVERAGVTLEETAYIGDDLPDWPPVAHCGLGLAVPDAAPELLEAADAVTSRSGGHGAVREVIEAILRRQGKWDDILSRYRAQLPDSGASGQNK